MVMLSYLAPIMYTLYVSYPHILHATGLVLLLFLLFVLLTYHVLRTSLTEVSYEFK